MSVTSYNDQFVVTKGNKIHLSQFLEQMLNKSYNGILRSEIKSKFVPVLNYPDFYTLHEQFANKDNKTALFSYSQNAAILVKRFKKSGQNIHAIYFRTLWVKKNYLYFPLICFKTQ